MCLSAHTDARPLLDSLARHGEVLADPSLYRAGHNHGLDQDIGLLVIGSRLGRTRWRNLAIRRMIASAELAIDAQGVLHEQAPRYGLYVHRRLGVALRAIEESGARVPPQLVSRRKALEDYVAHATRPDGYLLPIGDGPADLRPPAFAVDPGDRVRVFDGGYVFGRTAWDDPGSAHYSIRFGPGRRLHGHEDHLGVTYYAHGRPILVEAGFHSYEKTPHVAWTRLPEAHNVPIVCGATFRPGTATHLLDSAIGPAQQAFTLCDDAYGVRRTREVMINHGLDVLAVHDVVASGATARSRWHFDPSLRVVSQREGTVVLGAGDWRVSITHLRLPGGVPAPGQSVRQGLISPGYLRTAEAQIVISPPGAEMLTVVVPGCADPGITVADGHITVTTPAGTARLVGQL